MRFTKPHNEEESFTSKIDKYKPMYKNRVIPVVIGYSCKNVLQKQIVVERTFTRVNRRLFNEAYLSLDNQQREVMINM